MNIRLIVAAVLSVTTAATAQMGQPATRVFNNVGIDQNLNQQIPLDLTFRDESGQPMKLASYFGSKPVIISLVYYRCPMLCTQVLNGMVETFKTIKFTAGKEFDIITVSIDPQETHELAAEKKEQYIEEYARPDVGSGWHFLTGDQKEITELAKAVGFRYEYDEKTKQFAHASGIMVATPEGKIARYLYGIEYPAKDLTFSLMEAAQNKIGSPVDKLLLLCYHYDPSTGKYGVMVTNLLRGGGVIMVLVVGGFMLINLRRERQKKLLATR